MKLSPLGPCAELESICPYLQPIMEALQSGRLDLNPGSHDMRSRLLETWVA